MNQAQFANLRWAFQGQFIGLSESLAKAYLPRPLLISDALAKAHQPLFDAVLALARLDYSPTHADAAPIVNGRLPQRFTDREVATMLTVAAFLFVFISFALLIKHSPQIAKFAA